MNSQRRQLRDACRTQLPYNYQLWLLTCLVQINDFEDAALMILSLWGDEKLDLTIHKDLLNTLFESLEVMIRKLQYQNQSNNSGNQP